MYDLMRRDAGSLCAISLTPTASLRLRHVLRAPLVQERGATFRLHWGDKIDLIVNHYYPNPKFRFRE